MASCLWCGVRAVGRPNLTPRAFARVLPSPVRAMISSRSNSASPPNTVSISLPCGVVVSAQVSFRELKPALRSPTAASTLSRSRVERASRSSRVTISTSPWSSRLRSLASSARSKGRSSLRLSGVDARKRPDGFLLLAVRSGALGPVAKAI